MPEAIHFYWRPGCPFCTMLRRGLDKRGISTTDYDIWSDAGAAAIVRKFANGNETVPTVIIGETGFVNPSAKAIEDYLQRHAPHLLPATQA